MNKDSTTLLGFWVYLMTDFVLFAALFATFAVLRGTPFGGPLAGLFSAPFVLTETLILLTSSFTCGLALVCARDEKKNLVLLFLAVTFALGALFVGLEVSEFSKLIAAGHGPQTSGALSGYFALVGTHGLHVSIGLLWMLALGISVALRGLTQGNLRKLALLTLFWHFLDIIWIFIFTIVYMMGFI